MVSKELKWNIHPLYPSGGFKMCNGWLYLMPRPMGTRTRHVWTCSCGQEFATAKDGDIHRGIIAVVPQRNNFSTLPWFGPSNGNYYRAIASDEERREMMSRFRVMKANLTR